MKLLFWSALILAAIWYLMKRKLGANNDLFAHIEETRDLQRIGDASLGANQIGLGNFPLMSIGRTPLGTNWQDPFNPNNPIAAPEEFILWQSQAGQGETQWLGGSSL